MLHDERPLSIYRPDPAEVIGLAAFDVADVIALASGSTASAGARESVTVLQNGSLSPTEVCVARQDLVPYSAARLRRMLGSVTRH